MCTRSVRAEMGNFTCPSRIVFMYTGLTFLIESVHFLSKYTENLRLGILVAATPTAHTLQSAYGIDERFRVNSIGHLTKQLLVEKVAKF